MGDCVSESQTEIAENTTEERNKRKEVKEAHETTYIEVQE
jgi:hypothetical protein